jgi:hypothetical protein
MPGRHKTNGTPTVFASESGCETRKAVHGLIEGSEVTHPARGATQPLSRMVAEAGIAQLFPATTLAERV